MVEEAQMIEGCIKRDSRCQTLLYEEYAPFLYGVALRYTKTEEDAQDVLQDAFIRIFDTMEQYEGKGSLRAWMRRIVANQAFELLKHQSKATFVNYDDYEESIADESIVESDKLTHKILLDFIKELPQKYQTVFNLCVIDGYSYSEAAEKLKNTEAKCRIHLFRARNILKGKVNNFLEEENKYKYDYENIQ